MDQTQEELEIIGRAEKIAFPTAGISDVPAKIDTGAYRTSVWASNIEESDDKLSFTLFGEGSQWYTGETITVDDYKTVEVENSFGHSEKRYSLMMSIRLAGRRINTNITLSDRENKTYPVLVGRKMIRGKFMVDVSIGTPLDDEETEDEDSDTF